MQALQAPRYQASTEPKQGDYYAALWTSFLNCINGLKFPVTASEHGIMVSTPTLQLVEDNIRILSALILKRVKDTDYKPGENQLDNLNQIVELFDRKQIFKERGMDLGHV